MKLPFEIKRIERGVLCTPRCLLHSNGAHGVTRPTNTPV